MTGWAGTALSAARAAQAELAAGGWPARRALLKALRLELVSRLEEYSVQAAAASGKPKAEAVLSEIYPALEALKYYERGAELQLAPRKEKTPFFFTGCSSRVEQRPYGVVLVAAPYNFPFQLAFIPAITALAAGNAVIIKPSELCPGAAELLRSLLARAGVPDGLVQVAAGGAEAVRALIEAGPDKVFFTGGTTGGREVMKLCAAQNIPLALELGGKAPMLVFADADLNRAVQGALYGAFCNAGQVCVSVERIYVEEPLYGRFCEALAAAAGRLSPGIGGDYGPMVSAAQADKVLAQVREAVAAGAELLTPEKREGNLLWPLVVAGIRPGMRLAEEETFGPAVGVASFSGEEAGLALANAGHFGLAASVWTNDRARAARVCAKLEAGQISVNDCLRSAGSPYLPFGGVKGSGFGRSHGREGLLEFSRTVAVMECSGNTSSEVHWFPYGGELSDAMLASLRAFLGPFSARAWKAALGARKVILERAERKGGG